MFKKKSAKSLLFSLLMMTGPAALYADDILAQTDEILNSEQIDIEGSYTEAPSQADKIAALRKKLEKKNEDMMHKKIEDIRIKEEVKLTNRLQSAFDGGMQALDEDPAYGTAPAQKAQVTQTVAASGPSTVKVIPSVGMSNYQGENLNYDSNFSGSVDIDIALSPRFSMGFGFSYENLQIIENLNGFNNFYNQGYFNSYGTFRRELSYRRLSMDIHGKFYFTTTSMVKPFIGLGASLNRGRLFYETQAQNGFYNFQGQNLGQEEYRSSYVTGEVSLGTEILFTQTFGLSVAANYIQGFNYGFQQDYQTYFYNPDQERLNNHGAKIEEASILSAQIGLVLQF